MWLCSVRKSPNLDLSGRELFNKWNYRFDLALLQVFSVKSIKHSTDVWFYSFKIILKVLLINLILTEITKSVLPKLSYGVLLFTPDNTRLRPTLFFSIFFLYFFFAPSPLSLEFLSISSSSSESDSSYSEGEPPSILLSVSDKLDISSSFSNPYVVVMAYIGISPGRSC